MKTVILAAGKGTRLAPLTNYIAKPMVKIVNKPILEHILNNILDFTNEVIIITKYKEEQIKNYFKDNYKGIKISYKTQSDQKGTASALFGLNIDKDFVVLNGDTIYSKKDLEKLYNLDGYGCLVKQVEEPEKYGIFEQDENGYAISIIEKPKQYIGNLANMGVYKFPKEILEIVKNIEISPRGEYELPDAINLLLKKYKYKLIKQEGEFIDIGYLKDILKANQILLEKMGEKNLIGENTFIKNEVIINNNVVIGNNCNINGKISLNNVCIYDNTELLEDGIYENKIIFENQILEI